MSNRVSPYFQGRSNLFKLRAVTVGCCIAATLFFTFSQGQIQTVERQTQSIRTSPKSNSQSDNEPDDITRTRYSDRVWVGKRYAPDDLEEQCASTEEGVRGYLKNDAILTFILLPKSLGSAQKNSGGELHLRHLMHGWSKLPCVNFLIMSASCGVLKLADEYGLPTVRKSSGSDVEDLTYKHLLRVVNDVSDTPFVGYVNSDIVFDEGLPQTIEAAIRYTRTSGNRQDMTMIGYRFNSDVPDNLFTPLGTTITLSAWTEIVEHMRTTSTRFMHQAQDYFIFSRNGPLDIDNLPPFFVGGVAFDNFLSQTFWQMDRDGKSLSVDATGTMKAFHINHGGTKKKKLKLSHLSVGSDFNRQLIKKYRIKFKTGEGAYMTDHKTITSRDSQGNVVFLRRRSEDLERQLNDDEK